MRAILSFISAIILVGCAAGPSASPSPSPGVTHELTPWETEMANLQPDGTRSLESALKLFAMAFGPIPGVDATTAAVGTVDSATPAVRVVLANRDLLTPEQRAAVDRYLSPPADARTIDIPPAGETSSVQGLPGALALAGDMRPRANPYYEFEGEVLTEGQRVRSWMAGYWGDMPALSLRIYNMDASPYISFALPTVGAGGFERCEVFVNKAVANADRFQTRRALTMDIVHCFQSWKMGSEAGFLGQVPAWAWEGPAEYIVLEMWATTPADRQAWLDYLEKPDISLFARVYDAAGYYAQLRQAGLDLAVGMEQVLTNTDNPQRFALAGTNVDAFLDTWASGLARMTWGGAWLMDGPSIPTIEIHAPREPFSVTNGSQQQFTQDAYTNHVYAMHSEADIVRLEFIGRPRLGDGAVDTTELLPAIFCTSDKGCSPCPDFQTERLPRLQKESILAVSGGIDGTTGTVTGIRLEDHCGPTPRPPQPPKPCGSDCATSAGDPHIVTVDTSEYDFQAAGEFVLVRSADGSFEIQARQEPWPGMASVSLNTAATVRIGDSRLAIYEADDAVRILLDGNPVAASQPLEVGGATVLLEDEGFMATFADGTVLYAFGLIGDGVNVVLQPSAALAESGTGLFGRVVDGSMGVPALPDGTVLPAADDPAAYEQALYKTFADAWRVTQATSLFDYTPGTTTDTYTLRDVPGDVLTLVDLTPEQRAAGETACANIDADLLNAMCAFDVGVTSDTGLTSMYDITQNVVETGSISESGTVEETRPPR